MGATEVVKNILDHLEEMHRKDPIYICLEQLDGR